MSTAQEAGALDVQTGGHGEPELIFLPAADEPTDAWDHVVARFEVAYRCHVVEPASSVDRSPDALAGAVISYAREQGLVRPVLIGHGTGGVAALTVALRAPDLPGGIVLMDDLSSPAAGGFSAADLHRVRCPTLVLGALAGRGAAARQLYRRRYRGLAGARFVFFERTRRFLTMDDLDGFTDALRRELATRR